MSANSMTAVLMYALSSERKLSVVANMIKGKPVDKVLMMLQYLPKKAAKILFKVVKSATANAKHNLQIDSTALHIARVDIGKGPTIKRVRPVGRSRMHGYVKQRSFVRVVLDTK
jgi:large subunit ribosomal protein L22